jgi:hypothetical protein
MKSLVFDVLDIEIDRLILTELKLDLTRPSSLLHKFTWQEQVKLIKSLRKYLDDEGQMTYTSDGYTMLLEELLYFLVTDSVISMLDNLDFCEDIWEDWKDMISLTIVLDEDESLTDDVVQSFVNHHLWHHKDWHFLNIEDEEIQKIKNFLNQ